MIYVLWPGEQCWCAPGQRSPCLTLVRVVAPGRLTDPSVSAPHDTDELRRRPYLLPASSTSSVVSSRCQMLTPDWTIRMNSECSGIPRSLNDGHSMTSRSPCVGSAFLKCCWKDVCVPEFSSVRLTFCVSTLWMVCWEKSQLLRLSTRLQFLTEYINEYNPKIICGHSEAPYCPFWLSL